VDQKQQTKSLWDEPDEFYSTPEWQLYREKLLDRLVALYFEMAGLRSKEEDFVGRFNYLQGMADLIYNELMLFDVKSRKAKPEELAQANFMRRTGLVNRLKEAFLGTIGANKDE
jgi:hypothetical protein